MSKLTYRKLKLAGACESQAKLFRTLFPEGVVSPAILTGTGLQLTCSPNRFGPSTNASARRFWPSTAANARRLRPSTTASARSFGTSTNASARPCSAG